MGLYGKVSRQKTHGRPGMMDIDDITFAFQSLLGNLRIILIGKVLNFNLRVQSLKHQ